MPEEEPGMMDDPEPEDADPNEPMEGEEEGAGQSGEFASWGSPRDFEFGRGDQALKFLRKDPRLAQQFQNANFPRRRAVVDVLKGKTPRSSPNTGNWTPEKTTMARSQAASYIRKQRSNAAELP